MIRVDSTVVRSTQKPLICTRLSEGGIIIVVVIEKRIRKKRGVL